jgi:hypothetical protein
MLWGPVKPLRARSKPAGFIAPCQAALTDKPPSGPDWSHEIKFDGYRLIARKDGERVRLWARTTTDYTPCLSRIRGAVAAVPAESVVIDGEAVVLRPDALTDFHALRSSEGQARAVMIAFDLLEHDGEDIRHLPIEERRARLTGILKPRSVRAAGAIAEGIQLSEPLIGKGEAMFREACRMGLEGHRVQAHRLALRERSHARWLKTKDPRSSADDGPSRRSLAHVKARVANFGQTLGMPRYFFNVHDGKDLPDDEGIELPGRNEAHRQAIITAGEMLRESDRKFLAGDIWEMHVTDARGTTVCRLRFSAEDCD